MVGWNNASAVANAYQVIKFDAVFVQLFVFEAVKDKVNIDEQEEEEGVESWSCKLES